MESKYTSEKNIQIVIALLKAHGIRRVIASPGGTNVTFVASIQQDPFFEIFSSPDERSASYIACGLAAETGEPVVLSCTGATSSRNYMPGLTEAYYRKLPVLAITSGRNAANVGHHIDQVIDRSVLPKDVAKMSVHIPSVKDDEDEWDCMIKANKAMLALKHHGGGPVHINLPTTYSRDFSVRELPAIRVIKRICQNDDFPDLPKGKIGVFVGSHIQWSASQTESINNFCIANNAVILCDHTSNYFGKYKVLLPLLEIQNQSVFKKTDLDLLIHIGEISNISYTAKEVWRISEDGEIRDTFHKLRYVFEMSEQYFFQNYSSKKNKSDDSLLVSLKNEYADLLGKIPELPFSNIWVAQQMAKDLPENSVLHLGIRNSIRSWSFFEIPSSVLGFSNVGGFGIDGGVSSLIGASFGNKNKLYFGVFGDLAFFYDMNSLGNRHISNNVRILLVNNGRGQEFRNLNSMASIFGEHADDYIAAAGHYGNKSVLLVKHYAEDLGFEYFCASEKDEFNKVYKRFLTPDFTSKPIIFEVFTNTEKESEALKMISSLTLAGKIIESARDVVKGKAFNAIKNIIKK
jgi:2-succinyl-5-enolpyruvyl-6-hydroxy-3-cyclohexene-1-carboxylate synthase